MIVKLVRAMSGIQLLTVASALKLAHVAKVEEIKIVLPRPGCGNGRLRWEQDVKPIIAFLPDNVEVISK